MRCTAPAAIRTRVRKTQKDPPERLNRHLVVFFPSECRGTSYFGVEMLIIKHGDALRNTALFVLCTSLCVRRSAARREIGPLLPRHNAGKRTSRSLTFLVTRAHLHIRVIQLSFLQRDNGMSTANSVVEPAAPPLDASSKHTRACRRCGLVKTFDQVNSHLIDAVSSVSF